MKCAKHYHVLEYQKVLIIKENELLRLTLFLQDTKSWLLLNTTKQSSFQINAEFCREYLLGIRTEVGGTQSAIVPLSEALVTKIENPEYYILPSFHVRGRMQGASLSWEHRYQVESAANCSRH